MPKVVVTSNCGSLPLQPDKATRKTAISTAFTGNLLTPASLPIVRNPADNESDTRYMTVGVQVCQALRSGHSKYFSAVIAEQAITRFC